MKVFHPVTLLGAVAVTAAAALVGPGAVAAEPSASVDASIRLGGSWITTNAAQDEYRWVDVQGDRLVLGSDPSLSIARERAAKVTLPFPGEPGPIMVGDRCLADDGAARLVSCDAPGVGNLQMTRSGLVQSTRGVILDAVDAAGAWQWAVSQGAGNGGPSYQEYILISELSTVVDRSPVVRVPAAGSTILQPKPNFAGTGQAGATIELIEDSLVIATTVVGPDHVWEVKPTAALTPGLHVGQVRQTFDGVESTGTWSLTYADFAELAVTAPRDGDDVLSPRPTFTGTGEPGATIFVADQRGLLLVGTQVDEDGAWSQESLNPLVRGYTYRTIATQRIGDINTTVPVTFTHDLASVERVDIVSPTVSAPIEQGKPVFTGTGEPGSKVEIVTAWQDHVGETMVDANGEWSIEWNKSLLPARYTGGKVLQKVDEHVVATAYDFVVEDSARPVVVAAPAVGGEVKAGKPVFSGTGHAGAMVEIITAWGDNVGSATVSAGGTWSIEWNKSLLPARYLGGTTKQTIDGKVHSSSTYDFTVVR